MNSKAKQLNFSDKLTPESINALIAAKLRKFNTQFSYRSDSYYEGTLNGDIQFAAFNTPRGPLILVENESAYHLSFFTDDFWTHDCFVYGHNTEECFQLCIDILHTQPNGIHHNEALFSVLTKHLQPTFQGNLHA